MKPKTVFQYGMKCPPLLGEGGTWVEAEAACTDYGQFRRNAVAKHQTSGKLVACRADIPDTYFSIPATTKTEHGYLTFNDSKELEFRPHTTQDQTPAEFRKATKEAYK